MSIERPSAAQLASATPEELAQLAADCLALLEPGHQPLPLFKQFGRLVTLSTFEVTPLRKKADRIEVLLGKRSENDLWWPGQWNLPGSVLLPRKTQGISDYNEPTDTILAKEFKNTVVRVGDVTVFDAHPRTGVRGSEQTVFGWSEVNAGPDDITIIGGQFFDVEDVLGGSFEEDLVAGHEFTIEKALASYSLR